jgi:predicted DNA-binding protein with PD1-like motif
MHYRRFNNKVIVCINNGEEIVSTLKQLCNNLHITLGSITGIGATNDITIGLMNTKTKKYQSTRFTGDHEISSLIGNITTMNNEVYLHLHVTVCNAEHKTFGGHLTSAIVSATFEGVIDIIDGQVNRKFDQAAGLNLLDL